MTRGRSEATIRAVFVAALVGMGFYCATHLELSTDITNFMPSGSRAEVAVLASRLADSELTRTMIITVGADDPDTAVAAGRALAERLRRHPEVEWLRSGFDPAQLEQLYRIYFPRRHAFLSVDPELEIPAWTTPEALRQRAREMRARLALPMATLTKRIAGADPLGAFERVVARFQSQRPSLALRDGQFLTRDERFAVLFLSTRTSAFESEPQARLLADLEAAFREIDSASGGGLVLEASGSNRFAVAAEKSIRSDVLLISAVSLLGVAAAFLVFLRSPHSFLLAIFPPLSGALTAATVTRLALGRLDGLTMAFGTVLIGVAIDYSIHVLQHHRLDRAIPPRDVVRRLRPSLVLGALTTMASFAGLALTSFPGFREIGIFALVGVGASLVVTIVVLPGFMGQSAAEEPTPELAARVGTWLADAVQGLERRRRALVAVPIACVAGMILLVPRIEFDDDLSQLMALDPDLRIEEERVRARIGQVETGRVIFALGNETNEALSRSAGVAARLESARAAGVLEDFRSVNALLWSRELQERNVRALAAIPDLVDRVESAFVAEGFRPEALEPFREALAETPRPPLEEATLRASPLGDLIAPLLLHLGDRVAAVTYVRGVSSTEALTRALAGLEHVFVFDQKSFVNEVYREFRATTLKQMGVGSLLVVLVLGVRYRRWRPALAAFLPSLLVAGTLLAVFAATGTGVNLLHVTSLILVMGIGVDYGIFTVDSAHDRRRFEATLVSLLISCITTVFVFGTLALSQHAALQAIGITTGLGVLLSFVLAPVTLLLLRGGARAADP